MVFLKNPHYTLYLGTGLFQITCGLIAITIENLLLGVSLIVLYPYISPLLLTIFSIVGWLLLLFGFFTILFPFMRDRVVKRNFLVVLFQCLIIISTFLTFLLLPIGIFLGLGLISERKSYKHTSQPKIENVSRRNRILFLFSFIFGFFHLIFGILIILIIAPFLIEELDFLFPYVNYTLINILTIYGWLSCIAGLIVTFCSIWIKKVVRLEINRNIIFLRVIKISILIASVALLFVYPFGTYFGLMLLLELKPFKKGYKIIELKKMNKI